MFETFLHLVDSLALVAIVYLLASRRLIGLSGRDGRDGLDGRDGMRGWDGVAGVDGRDGIDAAPAAPALASTLAGNRDLSVVPAVPLRGVGF